MAWIRFIGNGYCNDFTNNADCIFDGGECCDPNGNTNYCQDCICYADLSCNGPLDLIGNGQCNNETNNAECNFDGGDCCGSCANTEQCVDCQCLDGSPINYLCKLNKHRALILSKNNLKYCTFFLKLIPWF